MKAGQNYRKSYQRRSTTNPDTDYYYMHRDTPDNETVIVEYGFLDSSSDDVSQLKNNWSELAEAVVKATVEYAGGVYKPLEPSNFYVVKAGDSLYSISRQFNISVDEIKRINELTSDVLQIGQILYLTDEENDENPVLPNSYIVKAGDSLYSISKTFGLTVEELKTINNLTSDNLSIGQVLFLSIEDEPSIPDDPDVDLPVIPNENTYVVKAGDTLYSIAKLFETNVDEIKQLNNLTSNVLSIGQILLLPTSDELTEYVIKAGDSLYRLAINFDTTVEEIKRINNLTSDILSIGQKILLPSNNSSTQSYTVKAGDSLYRIALKYGVSLEDLKKVNNLTSDILSIGQVLIIP